MGGIHEAMGWGCGMEGKVVNALTTWSGGPQTRTNASADIPTWSVRDPTNRRKKQARTLIERKTASAIRNRPMSFPLRKPSTLFPSELLAWYLREVVSTQTLSRYSRFFVAIDPDPVLAQYRRTEPACLARPPMDVID